VRALKALVRGGRGRVLLALGSAALVGVVYLFLATAGRMDRFPHTGNGYYEQLAVAFVDGHLDLIQRPDPSKSADDVRGQYWDLSLHEGRLYLYWGPAPALVGAALLRWFSLSVADDAMTVAFAVGRAVVGAMLLVRAKRVFFRGHPWWPTVMGIVTLAFGAPLTLVCARPATYEVAIVGDQFFLVAAAFVAFVALTRPRDPATRRLFVLVSALLALGVASRLAQILAAAAVAAITFLEAASDAPDEGRARFWLGDATALALPLLAGCAGLGVYDRVRFGSAFDTGLQHQLSIWTFHNGVRFVVPNLYSYVAKPPLLQHAFPYLRVAPWNEFALWRWFPETALHENDTVFEANVGFLWTTPFYALAAVAWLALARWVARAVRRRDGGPFAPAPRMAWFAAISLCLATLSMVPCLVAFVSAVRYLADASAGLAFGATLGLSLLVARPARSVIARRALAAGAGFAVAASLVVNAALWVEGPYGGFLRSHNARFFDRLSRVFPGGSGT
jgi:hypothetical protein